MNAFSDIRALLHRDSSEETWAALCAILIEHFGEVRCGDEGGLRAVLDYCTDHMKSWPEGLPTFAPRGWFQMSAREIAGRALTPFFVWCFSERTRVFIDGARRDLLEATGRFPRHIDLEALGEMKWRDGEAFNEGLCSHLVTLLSQRCSERDKLDQSVLRLRQLLDDEDAERWTLSILEQTRREGREGSWDMNPWGLFQFGHLAARHQFGFGEPLGEVDASNLWQMAGWYDEAHARDLFALYDLYDHRDGCTLLSEVALDAPCDFPHRQSLRWVLTPRIEQGEYPSAQHFLRGATDYNAHLYTELSDAEWTPRASLGLFRQELTRAMIERAQVSVSTLRQIAEGTQVEGDYALGWIIFATEDGVTFRLTERGPVTLRGDLVDLGRAAFVTIAHPLELDLSGELGDWWERFAEVELDERSVQLDRDLYYKPTPEVPRGGIPILYPQLLSTLGLRLESSHRTGPGEGSSIFLYGAPGYAWELAFHACDYVQPPRGLGGLDGFERGADASFERVVLQSRLGPLNPLRFDRVLHSEVCRIARVVQRAVLYGEFDGEPLLP